jgi:hypothetical protein
MAVAILAVVVQVVIIKIDKRKYRGLSIYISTASKYKKALHFCKAFYFAPDRGLEPRTYGLTVRRSNQLS